MTSLSAIAVSWPLAVSMAVVTVHGVRVGRKRTALNRALHELRRPLQAIALAADPRAFSPEAIESSVQLAAAALEQLEHEINGGGALAGRTAAVPMRPLVDAAARRWAGRADTAGGSLAVRWRAGGVTVVGDPRKLAQALDNLIVNAIEHGGGTVVVEGRRHEGRLRVCVADGGCRAFPPPARRRSSALAARLTGKRRRGHGLDVVRRVASAHGGRFALSRSRGGSMAVIELPLAQMGAELTA